MSSIGKSKMAIVKALMGNENPARIAKFLPNSMSIFKNRGLVERGCNFHLFIQVIFQGSGALIHVSSNISD